jgi:hypothetical protein
VFQTADRILPERWCLVKEMDYLNLNIAFSGSRGGAKARREYYGLQLEAAFCKFRASTLFLLKG